jgi:PAS domain-containing protein
MKLADFPRKRAFGTVQLSLTGIVEFADLDYTRLLGRPLEDLIGRSAIDLLLEEEREPAKHRLRTLLDTGQPAQIRKQYIGRDLNPVSVLTNSCLLRNPDGRPVGILVVEQRLSVAGATSLKLR